MKPAPYIFAIALSLALCGAAQGASTDALIENAESAIAAGRDAHAEIDALLAALTSTRNEDTADDLLEAIEEIGDADGASPQAVKQYVRKQAPAALRQIMQGRFSWSLRSDAVMLHRTLEASDADLQAAIDLAKQDKSEQRDFFISRGELLEDWLKNRSPQRRAELDAQPSLSPAATTDALARARRQDLSVSVDQLMTSAREGKVDEVNVLLNAGLDVNVQSSVWMSPLAAAATGGCALPSEPIANNLIVMELLLSRGANPDAFDERGNSILMSAVQQCPIAIVLRLLDGGAQVNPVNKQDFTPLDMSLILGKIDIAELLVQRGARRDAEKLKRLFVEDPTDPRIKAVVAKASSKGK